jgi:hypothetical protein
MVTVQEQDFGYAAGPMVYAREVVRIFPVGTRPAGGVVDYSADRLATDAEVAAYRA